MSILAEFRARARFAVAPILCTALMAYYGFHAIEGERGLKVWWSLKQQAETQKLERDQTRERREQLERRVALLGDDKIDTDMLEEQARQMLNLSRPDEIIILYDRPTGLDPVTRIDADRTKEKKPGFIPESRTREPVKSPAKNPVKTDAKKTNKSPPKPAADARPKTS
ncbi:MAG: septum formation initiator family protein [Alphaproteobacteria bacterium]